MSYNKFIAKTSEEGAEAIAASAAVLYYIDSFNKILSLPNPSSCVSGWLNAARLESIGKVRYQSPKALPTSHDQSLWQLSLKSFTALFLALSLGLWLSEQPAYAGLLSFLFHKKKHQVDSEMKANLCPDSSSGLQSFSSEQSPNPSITKSFSYQHTPNNNRNQWPNINPNRFLPPIRQARRDWSVPQPLNCQCLKEQGHIIRIALALNCPSFELITLDGAEILNASNGEPIATLPSKSRWSAGSSNQSLIFRPKQSSELALAKWSTEYARQGQSRLRPVAYYRPIAPVLDYTRQASQMSLPIASRNQYFVRPLSSGNQDGVIGLNGRFFRGALFIEPANPASTAFNIINYLSIEDYLLSVVPSEMPSAWSLEALKAQAIAARSYAYANLGKHSSEGYDLKDNTEDQAYSGIKSEYDSTNTAVSSTNNLVMKYDGKPICAYFHSTSGGSTDLPENVWSKSLPYLKAVPDYDDLSPHFSWSRKFSTDELEEKMTPGLGPLLTVFVVSRSQSKRVSNLLVIGRTDAKLISGESARRQLHLPSTNFNVFSSVGCYIFCGRGFGHGLGLSQWGAKALAEQGYNAAQILAYYYKDIVVEPVVDK